MKLSVIMPVFNERPTLARILEQVERSPVDKEVIIVDDGSTDGGREMLAAFVAAKPPSLFRLIALKRNGGKGAAIREGLKHVTGDIVLIQDADCELDPADYPALVAPIVEGRTQVVYGSRFSTPAAGVPALLRLFNRWITAATNMLYGVSLTDEAAGYKVFTTGVLKGIPLRCRRFEFCPEVTAKLLRRGHAIVEVPVRYYPRSTLEGKKLQWLDGLHAFWTLLRYRWRD